MLRNLFLLFLLSLSLPLLAQAPKKKAPSPGSNAPLVVLDAGHGGQDLGAKSRKPFCEEKRIALRLALLSKKYLDQMGYRVLLTRTSDVFLPLARRVSIAHQSRCSLFVSLHFNSSPNKEAHGIEIFYYEKEEDAHRSASSKKLASAILEDVVKTTQAKSRGVKKGNFFVIREAKVPAVLIEGGFITNLYERNLLTQKEYIEKLARGIADGVDQYIRGNVKTKKVSSQNLLSRSK